MSSTSVGQLDGDLPGHRRLAHPIPVVISLEDGEAVAAAEQCNLCGAGDSIDEAMTDLREVLVESLEVLEGDELHLSPYLQEQLSYLRKLIEPS